jgi:hypothetical protein
MRRGRMQPRDSLLCKAKAGGGTVAARETHPRKRYDRRGVSSAAAEKDAKTVEVARVASSTSEGLTARARPMRGLMEMPWGWGVGVGMGRRDLMRGGAV